jgi:hypothetical protein
MDTATKREKDAGAKNLIGISLADDPPRLLIETSTLQTILPSYEFVKADFGPEIQNHIQMEFRRYLITIEGENLGPLFAQLALNRVGRITETDKSKAIERGQTAIRKIGIARLESTDEGE